MKINNFFMVMIICLSGTLLLNCSGTFNPLQKIEGKWTAAGDQGEGHTWYLEYTFKGNTYKMTGYPPISESGKMELKVANGDSLLIGFIVQKSDPKYDNHDEWLVIQGNQLILDGTTFNRSTEELKN